MAEIVPNKVPCSKKPTPTPTPGPTPVALCDLTGVKYFKLHSDIPGDYTKNCGLLGNEIDENFYFLRSMDIKSAYTIDELGRKILVLERVNCNRDIKVDITDDDAYQFRLEDGYMYILFPDGHEQKLGRFLVEGDNVHIVTEASMQGDGSYGKPIGIDLAYRTGTYMPADFFADLTCTAATLSSLPPIGHGHAIVTKENVSRFGALYTWDQAHKLDEALDREGHGWRLPSKEDWAVLLNWAEPKEEDKDHDTNKSGNFGCVAGNRLKSREYWMVERPATDPVDDFGFTIYPVGVCPENYNAREPQEYGFTGLYKTTSFWTSSSSETGEHYVRTFSYAHDDVAQFTESGKKRLSIRLVRDVESDFDIDGYADILGSHVPVVITSDGKQLWTSINVSIKNYDGYNQNEVTIPEDWNDIKTDIDAVGYFKLAESGDVLYYDFENVYDIYDLPSYIDPESIEEYNSFDDVPEPTTASPEYVAVKYTIHLDMVTEAKFYFNAWDGNEWHKKLIREGESVVLLQEDFETGCDTAATPYVTSANTNHEWRLFVNPQTGLDELIDTVDALKREFVEEFKEIEREISGLTEDVTTLSGVVADNAEEFESGLTSAFTAIAELQEELGNEISARTIADEELREAIEALNTALSAETTERIAADEELWDALSAETAGRIAADEELWDALSAETTERVAADENLQEQIDELAAKTIEPGDDSIVVEVSGYSTTIRVQISETEDHLKLSDGTVVDYTDAEGHDVLIPEGLYIDMDFGEFED